MPVDFLPGIGQRTANILKSLDIKTIGQFKSMPEGVLVEIFGPSIRKTYAKVCGGSRLKQYKPIKRKKKRAKSWYQKIHLASQIVSLL